ncbi:hydrogen gas-evolving membrane-bound hydrogenase subunit E [Nitrospira sp. T9]|uniref:hydrogen gas-evolving membrane-bound hydrogenase subunit E n=1 Tax=unclassified Nitrospira TaxID=2652172 RepID=UPI003F98DE4B
MIRQILLPLLIAFCVPPAVLLGGIRRPKLASPLAIAGASVTLLTVVMSWRGGGHTLSWSWVPNFDIRFMLVNDGLALLYSLIAAGIGLMVLVYSSGYLPHYLKKHDRPLNVQASYYAWLALFMASMLGLVMAADLILLFVFFDLTAVCSYFLIAFDRTEESRSAALSALLVTGITSVGMLIGILWLYAEHGTFSIKELIDPVKPGITLSGAMGLMALAAVAKSAQVPLHFWLPRAMSAPTPVSAYLHSAAMVAAGVFVLHRLNPLIAQVPVLQTVLMILAGFSILIGSLLALDATDIKKILAYSTVAQYGYVSLMLAVGGVTATAAAAVYVLVHALCKSALFMVAGAGEAMTGTRSLEQLGGLARNQPMLAITSALPAATLAGLPLTAGFFKDEGFFKIASGHSWGMTVVATAAAALTLTYTWRFWHGIFLGSPGAHAKPASRRMLFPIACLALLCLAGGMYISPAVHLATVAAYDVYLQTAQETEVLSSTYHFAATTPNMMAITAYGGGLLLWISRRWWESRLRGLVRTMERVGPDVAYVRLLEWMSRLADWLHQVEMRDLRDRIAGVLIPAGLLVGLAIVGTSTYSWPAVSGGSLTPVGSSWLLGLILVLAGASALCVVRQRDHLGLILTLTATGFFLALVYALLGAPDVSLVAVLVETVLTLLLLATLWILPASVLQQEKEREARRHDNRWYTVAGVMGAALVFVLSMTVLSKPRQDSVSNRHLELAEQAHAENIVAAILVDFRGLDTLGEATVIFVALLGMGTLLETGGRSRSHTIMMNTAFNENLARGLLLPITVVGIALLVKGYHETGGGFAGGMVVALGILLQYIVLGHQRIKQAVPQVGSWAYGLAAAGLGLMLAVSFAPLVTGHAPLSHVPGPGTVPFTLGSLEGHTSLLFELGIFLLVIGFTVLMLQHVMEWRERA